MLLYFLFAWFLSTSVHSFNIFWLSVILSFKKTQRLIIWSLITSIVFNEFGNKVNWPNPTIWCQFFCNCHFLYDFCSLKLIGLNYFSISWGLFLRITFRIIFLVYYLIFLFSEFDTLNDISSSIHLIFLKKYIILSEKGFKKWYLSSSDFKSF